MSQQRSRSLPQASGPPVCCFCGFSEDNEIEYGKLLTQDGIVTHYYCLLLSSNMEQNGNDDEGILGFMLSDIQKELRRGKRLSCFYCKKTGATLGCCNTRCKRVFHLPCGLQAGSLHQFFGEFRSFCVRHRFKQQIDDHIKQEAAAAGAVTCYICYEEVNPQNTMRTLWAPCCRKNAWFHRKCVQHLALSAGYFFKCPLCNNKQEFQEAMLDHGIYIPHQDASWELVPNAFQELLHRHNRCDADKCLCPKGRTHTGVNAKWELVLCRLCGSQGIHKACGHLKWASSAWECAECIGMLQKSDKPSLPVINEIVKVTHKIPQEDSSSDSDISVGGNTSPLPIIRRLDSPPLITSPFKLRPGPKSFKLQQVRNVKSMDTATIGTSNISLPTNIDISAYIGSESSTNINSNRKYDDQLLQVRNVLLEKGSLSAENTSSEMGGVHFFNSNPLSNVGLENTSTKPIQTKLTDPNYRISEVIVIDSDDEVEIIDEQPKQNVLTTKDGTKIEIHSLSQITVESQKVVGDVKVDEPEQFEQCELLHSQDRKNPPLNGLIQSNTSSVMKTVDATPTSIQGPKKKSHVLKLGVIDGNASPQKIIVAGKVVQNKNNSNSIVTSEDSKNEPIMNLKITNVTSLRLEDFANTSQELDELKNVNSGTIVAARDPQSSVFLQEQQQLQLVEIRNPTIGQELHPNLFQSNISTLKESNVKRKSLEYNTVDKLVPDLPNSAVTEQNKRARFSAPENRVALPQNANISCNNNISNCNEAIPIFMTSVPITCSENNNKFLQSTKTLQGNLNELQSSGISGIRLIHNADIQRVNSFCKTSSGTISTSSVQNETNKDTNYSFVINNKNTPARTYGNPIHQQEVRKAYIAIQPQLTIQHSVENVAVSNTNIQSITHSSVQNSLNDPLNLSENSSTFVKPQTSAQHVPSSSERVALTLHGVHQTPNNVNRDVKNQNESRQGSRTNFPLLESVLCNGISKNCSNTPTGNKECQPDLDKVPQTDNLLTQLSDGFPITSVCDGDAGTSPAAEAGFTRQAVSGCSVDSTAKPIISEYRSESTTKAESGAVDNTSVSTHVSALYVPPTSPSTVGKHCDRPRLIPEKVPLTNLKFRILDSNIVQMFVYDAVSVKININADDQRNDWHGAKSRRLAEVQKPYSSPARCSESQSLTFYRDKTNDDTGEITKKCGLESFNSQYFKNRAVSPKKLESPRRSRNMLDRDDVQGIAATITNNRTEGFHNSEKNCNDKKWIPDVQSNEALSSVPSDQNYYRVKKNKPLVFSCFKNDEENYLCAQKVSKKKWYLKNTRNQGDDVVATDKYRVFGENSMKTSPITVKNSSDIRRLSSHDLCRDAFYYSHNSDEMKSLTGSDKVSKRLLRDKHNSSELNPPVNCYNTFKNVRERSSKLLDYDKCNLDTNAKDLLKSNCNIVSDCRLSENNQVLDNLDTVKINKRRDNSRLNNIKVQSVDTSLTSNTCHVLGCKNMYESTARDTCVETEKTNVVLTDQIGSDTVENVSGHEFSICEQLDIKVRIDLERIQTFIENKPQLFNKRSWVKSKQDEEDAIALSLPNLYKLNPRMNSLDCTTQIIESVDDVEDTHVMKKLKYDLNLFKEHSEN